jgi:hypothetical protein
MGSKIKPIQSGSTLVNLSQRVGVFRTFPSERAKKPGSGLKNQTELKRIRFNPL